LPTGVELGPVRLATELEVVACSSSPVRGVLELEPRLVETVDRRLLPRAWRHALDADRLAHLVVDPLVRPDPTDQQKDHQDDC